MEPDGSKDLYALKSIFKAHDGDVNFVEPTVFPHGGIFTGSRDGITKVWAPEGKSFKEICTFKLTEKYISSLCVLPPTAMYPEGLFLAGCNDYSIYGFTPDSPKPNFRLFGHSGAVCSLYGKAEFFISGSWDQTARVWCRQQCIAVLLGHEQAVLAIDEIQAQNSILTGSADNSIRLWQSGKCEKVFKGHEGCVRGLAVLSDSKFLSCSNDTTVRLWLTSGECLQIFQDHTNYVYDIGLCNHRMDFATCGWDQHLKIWRNGACIQTFVLPSKSPSLWNIACLSNGDLAVGTSDGKVYVFKRVSPKCFDTSMHCKEFEPVSGAFNFEPGIEGVVALQNNSMYICQYDKSKGTEIKKAKGFKLIEAERFLKPIPRPSELSATNNGGPTKRARYEVLFDVENPAIKIAFNKGDNPIDVATAYVKDRNLPIETVGQIVDYNTARSKKMRNTIMKNEGVGLLLPISESPLQKFPLHTDEIKSNENNECTQISSKNCSFIKKDISMLESNGCEVNRLSHQTSEGFEPHIEEKSESTNSSSLPSGVCHVSSAYSNKACKISYQGSVRCDYYFNPNTEFSVTRVTFQKQSASNNMNNTDDNDFSSESERFNSLVSLYKKGLEQFKSNEKKMHSSKNETENDSVSKQNHEGFEPNVKEKSESTKSSLPSGVCYVSSAYSNSAYEIPYQGSGGCDYMFDPNTKHSAFQLTYPKVSDSNSMNNTDDDDDDDISSKVERHNSIESLYKANLAQFKSNEKKLHSSKIETGNNSVSKECNCCMNMKGQSLEVEEEENTEDVKQENFDM